MTRIEYLRSALEQVEADLERARGRGNYAPVASLWSRALKIRGEIDAIEDAERAKTGDDIDTMDDASLLMDLTTTIAALPDHLAEDLLEQLAERLGHARVAEIIGPMPLRVVTAGEV